MAEETSFAFTEIRRETQARGRFIAYQEIIYRGPDGKERKWETVERARKADAVMVIPWLRPSGRLLLIRQLRPPAQGAVLEFPAGLVEAGEDPRRAAERELSEETGYQGVALNVLPVSYNTPGISGETVLTVFVDIDENSAANLSPTPAREECEWMEMVIVERGELRDFIDREAAANAKFDSKVLAYLLGMLEG